MDDEEWKKIGLSPSVLLANITYSSGWVRDGYDEGERRFFCRICGERISNATSYINKDDRHALGHLDDLGRDEFMAFIALVLMSEYPGGIAGAQSAAELMGIGTSCEWWMDLRKKRIEEERNQQHRRTG